MIEQTAMEWLLQQIENKNGKEFSSYYSEFIEQAKEIEYRQFGLFMNWLIKHYSTATIDGMFGWVNAMNEEVTIKEILDDYYKNKQ